MIAAILLAGFLSGLDNLHVCSGIGLLPMARARRHWLAAAFTLCETTAPVIGIVLGQLVLARFAGPAITMACGLAVLATTWFGQHETDTRPLFGLPLSLSLDNVAAGIGISPIAHPVWVAALAIGLVSALMSCAGLYGGAWMRPRIERFLPARAGLVVGGYLCVLSLRMLLKGAV